MSSLNLLWRSFEPLLWRTTESLGLEGSLKIIWSLLKAWELERLAQDIIGWVLGISRDGDSTTPWGNYLPCSLKADGQLKKTRPYKRKAQLY